ncbi:YbfB/YjiJ family MFS transporter [Rhodococcus sp. ACPA1]|uniref:YbfB/YjiJ family MFS transporter n=1 Tax=Rhodococcus sp. ACPA1 TaxID=2028572 RepID=UPI000BB0E679|nr:YbfB/YjiJ family MFS transporter [Rhodococcus sp. ACPA1]PBC53365.1 MFS transporter [Rhodococcus sp. ACPA1]
MNAVDSAADLSASRTPTSPWVTVGQVGAALAASMGIGRFVYTPVLPLMEAQAGLTPSAGAALATANYLGYLVGALAGIVLPAVVRSAAAMRVSLLILTATLAFMPVTSNDTAWAVLRCVAGATSALVFVIAVSAMHSNLSGHAAHLSGWAFGGIGAGIALSGLVVLILRSMSTWGSVWWAAALLTLICTLAAWTLTPERAPTVPTAERRRSHEQGHRRFGALFISYSLEGVGYIIAGTFLVAAIDHTAGSFAGSGAWVLVGLAALPSGPLWALFGRRWSRPILLVIALVIQAAGIALPAVADGIWPALVSAFLFGGTFLGISQMSLTIGAHLQFPRAVAILTTGYSLGQIAGPLIVTPLLSDGYHLALLVASGIVLAAALAAAVLTVRFRQRATVE